MAMILKKIIIFLLLACTLYAQENRSVLIVYFSKNGHTKLMAEKVAEGARSVDKTQVKLRPVKEASTTDLLEADAIILGSPVYNANVAPAMQEFINSWPFKNAPLKNKLGAAFTTAGGLSAGEELVQLNLLHSMLIFGMVVVGGESWKSAFGASAITGEKPFKTEGDLKKIDEQFLQKAQNLGRRVAKVSHRFKNKKAQ